MINLEDFQKCNIRIGTIESVNKIPEADKLLKFIIDFGGEKRQVMSGIAEFITDLESLVGKQVPVLLNLEPREFRGFESQGMILMADDTDKPILLFPQHKVNAGCIVR
ncbi:MAG: methionine--tRNA ligase [Patescibacteria group bacterium]